MSEFWKKITKSDIRNIISIIFVLGVIGYIYILIFKPVPSENKDLVNVLGGTVISSLGVVLGFYFGSSKSETDTKAGKSKITEE